MQLAILKMLSISGVDIEMYLYVSQINLYCTVLFLYYYQLYLTNTSFIRKNRGNSDDNLIKTS